MTHAAPEATQQAVQGPLSGLLVRPMLGSDLAYVAKTWYQSYQRGSRLPPTVYAAHYRAVIDSCLEAGTTLVLSSEATPTLVIAFACGHQADKVLYYAYTRDGARGEGCAQTLVRELFSGYPAHIECTARIPFMSKRYIYNPFRMGMAV